MGIERVTHYIDNVLTEAQARMGLSNTRLLVAWYTNWENKQSVVHSHPYHELVLPIGGSTVRYSVDGSVYLVHVGELVYFPSQVYHSGNFNIDDAQSDRLVIQIDDALWQATRRRVNLKNADWMHELTVLDSEACRKWDFKGLFIRMAQSQELSDSIREHLSRAFKECTMESIHNYLTYLRMQHCRKALEEGVSVLNACTESGFPDYSSFLKTFRRLYGITPAEYRAQHRTMTH